MANRSRNHQMKYWETRLLEVARKFLGNQVIVLAIVTDTIYHALTNILEDNDRRTIWTTSSLYSCCSGVFEWNLPCQVDRQKIILGVADKVSRFKSVNFFVGLLKNDNTQRIIDNCLILHLKCFKMLKNALNKTRITIGKQEPNTLKTC